MNSQLSSMTRLASETLPADRESNDKKDDKRYRRTGGQNDTHVMSIRKKDHAARLALAT